VSPQHTVVGHLRNDGRSVDANHQHVQRTVVEEHVVALLHVGSEVLIRQVHDVVRRVHLRTSEQLHHVARLIFNGGLTARRAHLRTLGVYQYADVATHLAHVPYNILYAILRSMGRIHTNDIHARIIELANEVNIAPTITH